MTVFHTPPTVVHKFDVAISETATVLRLPASAKPVLVAQTAPDYAKTVQLWAIIPTRDGKAIESENERRFEAYGTGRPIPGRREHVGSYVATNGGVWHVFENVSEVVR